MKPDWVGDSGASLERISAGELRGEIAPLRNGLPVAVDGVHRRSAGHVGLVVFMPGTRSRLAAQRAAEVTQSVGRRGGEGDCEAERG